MFVEISGKIYPVYSRAGSLVFTYKNSILTYDSTRDGELLDKEAAFSKYPEYFV